MSEQQQHNALQLADALEFHGRFGNETEEAAAKRRVTRNSKAAAKLRRLHALNTELLQVLRMARANIASELQVMEICHHNQATGLIDDAEAALLIEAEQDLVNQIDAAIAKATGEQARPSPSFPPSPSR